MDRADFRYSWRNMDVAADHSTRQRQMYTSRARLDQLLIAIRSSLLLCDHIRSKTRLIAIMNLIATLGIIYASLHNGGLSRVSADSATAQSLLLHTKRTQGERRGGD